MDSARSDVLSTLTAVKAFLAQESPPHLSEADTKAHFIEPLIRALGWEGIGSVTREYYVKNSQEFIDYVLSSTAGPIVAIETKRVQVDLADKHAAQLVQYCAVEGIEWAALTNGRELHLFNTFLKSDLDAKRVMRVDLLAFNTDEEFEPILWQLWQLSRERMTAPSGVRNWMHQRRMDMVLRQVLTNPASPIMKPLQALLKTAEIPATAQDLATWFRSSLTPTLSSTLPPATLPAPAPNPQPKNVATTQVHLLQTTQGGKLLPLVKAGILPVGTELVVRRRNDVVLRGSVTSDGMIAFEGATYPSPSDKEFCRRMNRVAMNGWRNWEAELLSGTVTLDELRTRLAMTSDQMNQAG